METRSHDEGETYVNGANEVFVAHENVRHGEPEDNRQHPCPDETFDRLLWRKLDELRAAKGDAADVGKDVIGDHQRGREEKPDHSLENVVHDEMRLHDNEVKRHMRPSKLRELKTIMALLERANKKDEAYMTSKTVSKPLSHA